MRISVVLPAPFSPRIASTSPARMSRSTSRSACTSPKRRETPTTWRPAGTGIHAYSGMNGTSKDPSLISAVRVSSSSIASGLIRSASSGLMTTSRPSSATPME